MVFFHVVKYGIYKSFSIFEWCNLHYEFAKSQERKQTSFSGLRKSAETLGANQKHYSTTNTTIQNANTLQNKKSCKLTRKPMLLRTFNFAQRYP